MKGVMFHVKHSPTGMKGKEKEYGVVHVQIDLENQTTWFVMADKDGSFFIAPAGTYKLVKGDIKIEMKEEKKAR